MDFIEHPWNIAHRGVLRPPPTRRLAICVAITAGASTAAAPTALAVAAGHRMTESLNRPVAPALTPAAVTVAPASQPSATDALPGAASPSLRAYCLYRSNLHQRTSAVPSPTPSNAAPTATTPLLLPATSAQTAPKLGMRWPGYVASGPPSAERTSHPLPTAPPP